MAFCTKCGAQVNGAFCSQCGTAAPGSPAAAPMSAPMPAPMPMPAAAPRRTSPVVWILLGIFGIIVLGVVGVVATGAYFFHRVGSNPAAALARAAAMSNRNLEVLSQDDGAGTVTIKDRETGKVVTLNFNDAKEGKFHLSAQEDNGKTADLQFGGSAKVPDWVPAYPGASVQTNISGTSSDGEGGNVTYTTSDSPSKVVSFYQDKVKDMGMKTNLSTMTGDSSMIIATDESKDRSLTIAIGTDSGKTTVNVTYGTKK